MPLSYKQEFDNAQSWQAKCKVVNLFHVMNDNVITTTASYFGISRGLVCEYLKLATNYDLIKHIPQRKRAIRLLAKSS